MRKNLFGRVVLVGVLAASIFGGCGKKDEAGGGGGGGGGGAAAVKPSQEMSDFLIGFNGRSASVEAQLKQFGAEGLDAKDMGMYDLASPKVVGNEKKGDKDCYSFDAKAGMTTRTYETCWTGGKIVEVTDKGMR